MIIESSTLSGLRTTLDLSFKEAYTKATIWSGALSSEVPSNNKNNTYGWIAQQVQLREWIGPRVALNLSEHSYQITNKKFEGTLDVDRDDIEDDNLGIYATQYVPQLAEATRKHRDVLLAALIAANPLAFDGKALFADDHPTYAPAGSTSTYDNNFTTDMSADNVFAAWAAMAAYVGEDGLPLGVDANLLIVPPQLKKRALDIVQSEVILQLAKNVAGDQNVGAAAATNTLKGMFDVLVVPQLAGSPFTWYLADTRKTIKPFVYQVRRAPEFVARFNPNDPIVFDQDKFRFGVNYRGNVGVSLPFLICKSAGSA